MSSPLVGVNGDLPVFVLSLHNLFFLFIPVSQKEVMLITRRLLAFKCLMLWITEFYNKEIKDSQMSLYEQLV